MEVCFSPTVARHFQTEKSVVKKWGPVRGRIIQRRYQQLKAASTLDMMRSLPQAKFHELKGDRKGEFAVDADYPFRIVFEPNHNPIPKNDDGTVDLTGVTHIRIKEVVNYHGD